MKCAICGLSGDYDGAIDDSGDWVCVDCWASGEAYCSGRTAVSAAPAQGIITTHYPQELCRRFVAACNKNIK